MIFLMLNGIFDLILKYEIFSYSSSMSEWFSIDEVIQYVPNRELELVV